MAGEASRLAWLGAERAALRHAVSWYRDPQPAAMKTRKDRMSLFMDPSKKLTK